MRSLITRTSTSDFLVSRPTLCSSILIDIGSFLVYLKQEVSSSKKNKDDFIQVHFSMFPNTVVLKICTGIAQNKHSLSQNSASSFLG